MSKDWRDLFDCKLDGLDDGSRLMAALELHLKDIIELNGVHKTPYGTQVILFFYFDPTDKFMLGRCEGVCAGTDQSDEQLRCLFDWWKDQKLEVLASICTLNLGDHLEFVINVSEKFSVGAIEVWDSQDGPFLGEFKMVDTTSDASGWNHVH